MSVDDSVKLTNPVKRPRHILRFSLRSWFIFLAILCICIVIGQHARDRQVLEQKIIQDGTLVYGDLKRHTKPTYQVDTGGLISRVETAWPTPQVEMRSTFPWLGKWSEGSPVFCSFESIEYHVGNVSMPEWVNEVLGSGELREISLRVNQPDIDVNLVTQNHGLVKLELMGTAHDANALQGIHKLEKLKELSIYAGFNVSFEATLPNGLPPNLVSLRMTKCDFESDDIEALKNCRKLEELTLRIGDYDLSALADHGLPKTLNKADFYRSRVTKQDLALLAKCPSLVELNLGGTNIDLREVDGLQLPMSMETLFLREAILDASTFKWLSRLSNLRMLDIRNCKFDDEDTKDIVLSPSLQHFLVSEMTDASHLKTMYDKAYKAKSSSDNKN